LLFVKLTGFGYGADGAAPPAPLTLAGASGKAGAAFPSFKVA
jgi:hypothetical protein